MLGRNPLDVTDAPEDEPHDYTVGWSESDHVDHWNAYDVVDVDQGIVVDPAIPDKVTDALRGDGWKVYFPFSDDLQKGSVREPVTRLLNPETTTYYVEEPPEYLIEEDVPENAVKRILNRRGIDQSGEMADWWYYPERTELCVAFHGEDDLGNEQNRLWVGENLDSVERRIIEEDYDPDGDGEDGPLTREEIREVIEENSPLYPREADIAACWAIGTQDIYQISDITGRDTSYQSIWQSIRNYKKKCHSVAWEIRHVWPLIPEDRRTEEMQAIIETVAAYDVRNPEFAAQGKGRGGGHPMDADLEPHNGSETADD